MWQYRLREAGVLLAVLLSVGGCSFIPALPPLGSPSGTAFKRSPPPTAVQAEPAETTRWTVLNDPVLDRLQTQLLQDNLTLATASVQVRRAQAALATAQASLWPSVNLNTGVTRSANQLGAAPGTSYSLGAPVSWEVQLWGRVDALSTVARAGVQASQEDLAAARLSLQATLVSTYVGLRTAERQEQVLRQAEAAQQRSLELTQARYQSGVVSAADVAQAQSQWKSTQAQRLDVGTQRAQLENALAVLLGKTPAQLQIDPLPADALWSPPVAAMPSLLPSTLIQRRPDIRAAQQRVVAANAQIGVARAAFFPTLSFSANAGYRNPELGSLISTSSRAWSLGPSLAFSVFDGGQRRAAQADAEAALEQATLAYRQVVLTAFQEVEDNLVAASQLQDQAQALSEALVAAQRNLSLTQEQYKAGTVSYLNVVQAQTTALTAQRSLLDVQSRRVLALNLLMKNVAGAY
ncbi:MAG: efflux transporter outer membrane subunit [Betaproteobacteria bacterium]|nr:efflux transporter outer membrane subunit [Betaproteobacteria bacterium]